MLNLLKKSSFFILTSIVIIFIIFFSKEKSIQEDEEIMTFASTKGNQIPMTEEIVNGEKAQQITLFVDVKGAVEQPGVYEMTEENRVKDVIEKAGGLTKDADQSQVNLAQKVHDEMIIIVPELLNLNMDSGQTAQNVSGNISGKVRINYATQDEIETLPGIGPSKAQAIIQHREEFGLFQSVEDLLDISGIGEKTLENMKDNIQLP
ncbi:helix-hairpin-helix domain-containing protein [Oceanobacillus sp. Castelsardo]|uniref:helix-hairpin-helix domain-containing protein n=1 Tax=Oceanobacillus sp. Castelsardo TaxID=1851204 RepID=UPI000838ACAE|nr:helix-hairpin-helix domain-containing protein [Oceanobacillus sp. Castelsardo]